MQARFLRVGDIIETEGGAKEVVRTVSVVLGLSNGNNPAYEPNTEIVVHEPEEVPGRTTSPAVPPRIPEKE